MTECKKLFVLTCGVLDPMWEGDKSYLWAIRTSVQSWLERATDEEIEKGFVDIPEGPGEVVTLVARRF